MADDTDTCTTIESALVALDNIAEGAWTGSHGGHDVVDWERLRKQGGLVKWVKQVVATNPHPWTYIRDQLIGKVSNPERLASWLVDQAKNTTKWRKGSRRKLTEAFDNYSPTLGELARAERVIKESSEEAPVQEAEDRSEVEVVKITFCQEYGRIGHYADGTTKEL